MATNDVQRLVTGSAAAPANFIIPGNGQMKPKAIYALFTGTSAGTPYLPALKITSDAGKLVGIYPTCASVAAGGTAGVSWFPEVAECCGGSGGSSTATPSGPAGGDLSGTYPNPAVANVSELTTKADVLVGAGGGISARLGVGADTTVLTADSAQTLGVKWGTISTGVTSFAESGQSALTGAVTISPGSGVTMTQAGQNVAIAASNSGAGSSDGWLDDTAETWTFASFTAGPPAVGTFTVTGDVTTKYTVGTRIKLTQTTVKFFVVSAAPVFAAGSTTVTITAGTDFTLANAAISVNFHSYEANPQGYPGWFVFNAAATGFSPAPTVNFSTFAVNGRAMSVEFSVTGTSNATTLTVTAPIASVHGQVYVTRVTDNGAIQEGQVNTATAGTGWAFRNLLGSGTGSFTNSGTKAGLIGHTVQI